MKKIILASIMMLSFGITANASNQEIRDLKAQQKALKLQTQLTNTQLKYEKAVVNLAEVKRKASAVNAEANNSVVTGLSTRNPEASAKAAKDRVKILKEANKMNKKVAKEEKKVEKLQKKIEKLQGEIDKLRQKVEFVGRW
ncbi:SlyB protein [Hoylesella loescheii]|uniref:SlyB protein n=1 Tax=Hoylesella loescheii TaxID=840 RepID=UPI00248D9566|nr:SlyB protein [Hoylesella loescheii]